MPDQLLTIFRLCFLVLLYLFFFRVLRAIWTEITAVPEPVGAPGEKLSRKARKALKNAPAPAAHAPSQPQQPVAATPAPATPPAGPAGPTGHPRALRAIDPPHLAGLSYPLANGMTFGRAGSCTVVLDDTFMSGTHLRLSEGPDGWFAEDLGSTNGTYLNRVRFTDAVALTVGDQLQMGNVVLEVVG